MPSSSASGLFPEQAGAEQSTSVRRRFIALASVLFLVIFAAGGAACFFVMRRAAHDAAVADLRRVLGVERLRLEGGAGGDIVLVRKLATSPFVKRHFSAPGDAAAAAAFAEEIADYRMAFVTGTVFWVNGADRIFHTSGAPAHAVNPDDPADAWYGEAFREANRYAFNIHYNPDTRTTRLRVSAPVRDALLRPLGVVGVSIDLARYIDGIFENIPPGMEMYLFNDRGQVTAARKIHFVEGKIGLDSALGDIGRKILAGTERLSGVSAEASAIQDFDAVDAAGGTVIAAFGRIPALGWNICALRPVSPGEFLPAGFSALAAFMIASLVLFVAFLWLLCARLIFRPLERLNDSVERLRGDAAESVLGLGRRDEFGKLANAIEHMKNRISGIRYAGRIQRNLLPNEELFRAAFRDHAVLWSPKDAVGGDIYWLKRFEKGTVLCVCDCTGHGTPGAMLTMLTAGSLASLVDGENCGSPARILWELDRRFLATINTDTDVLRADGERGTRRRTRLRGGDIQDGCDLAVLFFAEDGSVSFASGSTAVLVCDGETVTRHRGQRLRIGEGALAAEAEIDVVRIPPRPGQKIHIATDGLYEQPGGENGLPWGFAEIERIVLEHHGESLKEISSRVREAFDRYRGKNERCDDVSLISVEV